jgi:hypothetical protein
MNAASFCIFWKRVIRTIAMEATDGLQRGMEVVDTGKSISVPVGKDITPSPSSKATSRTTFVLSFL